MCVLFCCEQNEGQWWLVSVKNETYSPLSQQSAQWFSFQYDFDPLFCCFFLTCIRRFEQLGCWLIIFFFKFFFLVRLSVGIHRLQEKASFEYFWTCFLYVLLNYTIILVTILQVLRVIYIGSDSSVFYTFLFLICLHNTFCCSFTHR